MPFFTIFTPTYNRGYILPVLFESLLNQTCQDFEWVVVDDGSTDETASLIKKWLEADNKLTIKYYYKENGGKPRAINFGIERAAGKYFFMVDSDDRLENNALEKMKKWCLEIDNKKDFVGVGAARVYPNGEYIKGVAPTVNENGYIDATNLERKTYNLDADMCEAYKTEILKKFPMAEWKGEKFAPEQIALNEIALNGYKIRWYSDKIYICDYLEDGLTKGSFSLEKNNPMGYAMMYNHMLKYPTIKGKQKYYVACQHIALSIYGGHIEYIFKSNKMIYTIFALPFGVLLSFRRKKQFKGESNG